jgi:hypothetical protein
LVDSSALISSIFAYLWSRLNKTTTKRWKPQFFSSSALPSGVEKSHSVSLQCWNHCIIISPMQLGLTGPQEKWKCQTCWVSALLNRLRIMCNADFQFQEHKAEQKNYHPFVSCENNIRGNLEKIQ